jgi:hypothetical protein
MSESTTELETLRRTNAELVQKNATRKARIVELEASISELQGKFDTAQATIHEMTVAAPVRAMAESISTVPELFMEQFSKSYRVELIDGQLALQTTDGKPVVKDDKAVPFEQSALIELLTDEANPQAMVFRSITVSSKASGAATGNNGRNLGHSRASEPSSSLPANHFGLR